MSTNDFDRQRALGRLGELLVSRYLQSVGFGVLPSYDYSGVGNNKAPRLQFAQRGLVVPDLDCARSGARVWLEVKTYERAAYNRKRRADVHGIKSQHHAHYLEVEETTGNPAWVLFLEVETGALLTGKLSDLPWFACQCGGCESGRRCRVPNGPQIYVERRELRLMHTFDSTAMAPIRQEWSEARDDAPPVHEQKECLS
jgi:hypothetical protein